MENNWIKVFTTTDFFRAELVKQLLLEHDIPAVVLNKQDSSYRFGQVEVWAHKEDQITASVLIEEMSTAN